MSNALTRGAIKGTLDILTIPFCSILVSFACALLCCSSVVRLLAQTFVSVRSTHGVQVSKEQVRVLVTDLTRSESLLI